MRCRHVRYVRGTLKFCFCLGKLRIDRRLGTRTNNQLPIGLGAVEIAISWSRRFAKAMSVECIVGETWVGVKPPKLSPHFPPNTGPADW